MLTSTIWLYYCDTNEPYCRVTGIEGRGLSPGHKEVNPDEGVVVAWKDFFFRFYPPISRGLGGSAQYTIRIAKQRGNVAANNITADACYSTSSSSNCNGMSRNR